MRYQTVSLSGPECLGGVKKIIIVHLDAVKLHRIAGNLEYQYAPYSGSSTFCHVALFTSIASDTFVLTILAVYAQR